MLTLLAATLAMVVAMAAEVSVREHCNTVGTQLSVKTSRNATGHWLATVRLNQEMQLPGRPSSLEMDVLPTISLCRSVRTDSLLVTLQGPPPSPDPSYEEIPGVGYYKVYIGPVTWQEAKEACESDGAHLLIINSEAEAEAIKQLIKRHLINDYWVLVGFHDMDTEGRYVTVFGKPLVTTGYTRWTPGNPDNAGGNEDCGSIHSSDLGLNDYGCHMKTSFICEQIVN